MKQYPYILLILLLGVLASRGSGQTKSPFVFAASGQGVELSENGQAVYFYQKLPKSLSGKYVYNNYLHPLYSLRGDTLTQEFPADHPYHRGIFWAWHQIFIDDETVGDGWIMENIETEVLDIELTTDNHMARLSIDAVWKSYLFENRKPFVKEHTSITVHQLTNDIRKIDFEISLKAVVPGVEIGGSDDEKGYGGLCARLKLPDDLTFTSANGAVIAQTVQIKAGAWMDFSASFGKTNGTSGLSILCHPTTPNYPAPWILRSVTSMQNIVFPGRDRVKLPTDEPIVLRYRMIVHNGAAHNIDIAALKSEYEAGLR